MPKVSAKRQITIPIDQCQEANIGPGDEIETFIHQGHITIVKKTRGTAKGTLKGLNPRDKISDEESLQSHLENRRAGKV